MIYLPDGKALIVVDTGIKCNGECTEEDYKCPHDCCKGCHLSGKNPDIDEIRGFPDNETCGLICCTSQTRSDKRNVIIKIVDYPVQINIGHSAS